MCFNCRQEAATSALQGTPTAPYVRPADDIVHRHLGVLSIVAAAFSPLKSAPHGPIVAFLNCLNPTLGDTCGEVLYSAGLTCPSRLQDMELREVCPGLSLRQGLAILIEEPASGKPSLSICGPQMLSAPLISSP